MRQLTAELRARINEARRELAIARYVGDLDRIQLNEQRLRYLSGAAAEYGIVLAEPASQARLGDHADARG